MGADKALLTHEGLNMLERATILLHDTGCHEVILSGFARTGFTGKLIQDYAADSGPVSGILSVLRQLLPLYPEGSRCLFIPVDMPRLSSKLLKRLIAHLVDADGAHFLNYPLPICFRLTEALHAFLDRSQGLLDSHQKSPSIRTLISTLSITYLTPTIENIEQFINVNTPEDWTNFVNRHH
jgi:molybdopterin-guanine dinucleotide biosynthesis protein A